MSSEYKNINYFFDRNSGLLSVLSVFLIFISVSGKDFLPKLNYGIELSPLSEFLWISGMLIIIVCLITLVKESQSKKNSGSVKAFGCILFLALFCTVVYLFFALLLSENVYLFFAEFPRSLLIAFLVMLSPFLFVLIEKIEVKWIYLAVYLLLPLLAIIFLFANSGLQNWTDNMISKNLPYWFAFSVVISFIWTICYKISDYKKKISNRRLK